MVSGPSPKDVKRIEGHEFNTLAGPDDIFTSRPVDRKSIQRESRRISFLFYGAFYGPLVFLKATYRQLTVLGIMFIWGTLLFKTFNQLTWLSAFLGSVSTITTIGLYVPDNVFTPNGNDTETILLIIMIIVSVGAGASIVQSTVSTVAKGMLAKGETERRLIPKLKGHVVVFGYSQLGRYVVEKLDELGFDYVVITKSPSVYDELVMQEQFVVLESEIQPIAALKNAGIEKAAMIVVAHSEDRDNMLVILSARKLRPDIRIISVVHDQTLLDTAKNAGADVVIPASVTVGHLLALSAVTKDLVGVVFSEKIGTNEIAQFSIFKSSPLIGKGLQEVSSQATVIGVIRGEKVVRDIFNPAFRLDENDTLLVLGDPTDLLKIEQEAKAT